MTVKDVAIAVAGGETVSGVLTLPEGGEGRKLTTVILAHGAGGDMNHEFIVAMAGGLAENGYATLRFNFLYSEKKKKAPDSPKKLDSAWLGAFEFIRGCRDFEAGRIFVSGKSMGGRYASRLLSERLLPAEGLILFAYPLHPSGKKDRLRDEHLYSVEAPMLFIEGTRDSLCDLEKLEEVLAKVKAPWTLEILEGGDHSFRVLKSSGLSKEKVFEDILKRTSVWLEKVDLTERQKGRFEAGNFLSA